MKAIITGGGIIGLCSAWYLQESGWDVTVLDRGDLEDNCSYGNMGMITPSHFVPLAAPGIVSKGLRWMLNSRSPFYIRPVPTRALLTWGWQFLRKATEAHVEASIVPLRDINVMSRDLYDELAAIPGMSFGLQHKGIIMYYQSEKTGEEEAHMAEVARKMGLDAAVLDKAALQQLEPGISMNVAGGVHYRCDAHLYPNQLMEQLKSLLMSKGVQLIPHTSVKQLEHSHGRITGVITDTGVHRADLYIMATGAWAPELAALIGLRIPMMPGKGYSVTLDTPAKTLQIPAILCEARVALTPMRHKLRYGGTMEVGNTDYRVNMKRVEGIVSSVNRYFPGLEVRMPAIHQVWHGYRPCTADGMPFIGYAPGYDNLLLAGGHAMMGLSLGPATGKLLSELANGWPLSMDITAFSPDRFK